MYSSLIPFPCNEEYAPRVQRTTLASMQIPRFREVMGQCSNCKDLFGVMVSLVHGELYAEETARLHYVEGDLFHHCNGKVKLYGSTENLSTSS